MRVGLLKSWRGWWLVACVVAVLLGAAAWPAIAPRVLCREVVVEVSITGPGPVNLSWESGAHSNGIWIDPDQPSLHAESVGAGRRFTVYQFLPAYAMDRIDIRAVNAGASVAVDRAELITYFFRGRISRGSMRCTTDGPAAHIEPLASIAAQVLWGAPISALAGVLLVLVSLLTVRVTLLVEALRPTGRPTAGPEPRWVLALTIAVCVLAPAAMALWSPMLILADSTSYLWFAQQFLATGCLDHFDGWRLPGYSMLLIPLVRAFGDHAAAAGVVQAVLVGATSLMVLAMLRPRLRAPWPNLAAVIVAIDPILLGWQRVLMPECLSAFLVTAAGWLFLGIVDPCGRPPSPRTSRTRAIRTRAVLLGALLGIAAGYACTVRGNLQLVPAILIPALLWCALARRRWAPVLAAGTAAILTMAVMLPLFLSNQRHFGRFTFTVGSNFARHLFSWENGTTDWNQSGTLSFDEYAHLRTLIHTGPINDWDVSKILEASSTVPVASGTPSWLARDIRCKVFVDEALARRGPDFTAREAQGVGILLGLPLDEPTYGRRGTDAIFMQLRGEPNPRTTTNFDFTFDLVEPALRPVIQRSVHDIAWTQSSRVAHAYGLWFTVWWWLRPVFGIGLVAAAIRLVVVRDWPAAAIAALVLANAVLVPLLTYGCEFRYAAPFYPLLMVALTYGLFRPRTADVSLGTPVKSL